MWFEANGATRLALRNDGNVGMGTTSPTQKLDVVGNITISNSSRYMIGTVNVLHNAGTANILVGGNNSLTSTGSNNAFFGVAAGRDNGAGGDNTFIGRNAGLENTTGTLNVYVGSGAGAALTANGSGNTFVGYLTGSTNLTGVRNTLIGREANVGSSALQNATAIGNLARVDQDNSMVLGSINTVNGATADTRVGIGTTTPANRLTVAAGTSIGAGYTATAAPTNGLIVQGNVGIGTTNSAVARMEISSESSTTLNLNVNSISAITAYTLARFSRNNGLTGNISESNGTVSYNAFTGSHYAKLDEEIKYGELATLTGNNNILNKQSSEVIYGIAPSSIENDPKLLGSYLSPLGDPDYVDIHQVMAVGNGEVWVIDTGKDLEAGDYLISSSTKGHAMLDNETHDIAYVFARVAAPVRWDKVTETINGVKHTRVSIFYESFIKNNKAIKLEKEIATMKSEIEMIKAALGLSIEATAPAKNEVRRNEE
jgi:hypothetical protein